MSTCRQHYYWPTWPLKMGSIGLPETSVTTDNLYRVTSQKRDDLDNIAVEITRDIKNMYLFPDPIYFCFLLKYIKKCHSEICSKNLIIAVKQNVSCLTGGYEKIRM